VSIDGTSSNGHKAAARSARDVRDRLWFRIVALLVVLLIAFIATKSCARQQHKIAQDEAVAIARKQIDFESSRYQIRYLPQGLPPIYYWAVNFQKLNDNGTVVHTQVVLVNANTGEVAP
jgi:hypothetical protein